MTSSPTLTAHGWVVNLLQPEGSGTNNDLEGWHRKVKEIAGKNHLDIFEIIELFKKEQSSTEFKIRQLIAGGTRRRQAPHQRNKDIRIKAIVDNFDNYAITDYLTAFSYLVGK